MDQPAKPTVLVVDDEPGILDLMASVLEDEGFAVRRAGDGAEAWASVEALGVPDLVVSDIAMPRVDGPGLVRLLRGHGHAVPIVLVSAVTSPPRGLDAAFLPKPFDLGALVDTAHRLLAG